MNLRWVCVAAGVASVCTIAGVASGQTSYDPRSKISVTGEAVVKVKPDRIVLSFGVETWDKESISAAREKNVEISKRAITSLRQYAVQEKDIQTDSISIEPRYTNEYERRSFIGYFVRNSFTVTLTDASKVELVVTKVLEQGVTHIHSIDFQTTEFKKYREQARELALKAAREKAEKMAAVFGQKVGAPVQINEDRSWSGYWSGWSRWGPRRDMGMAQNVIQEISSDGGDGVESIPFGMVAIRANVSVTFELMK